MASKTTLVTLVPIRNMSRAIKFYGDVLGAKMLYRGEGAMKNSFASMSLASHELWFIVPEKYEKRTLAYTGFSVSNIKSFVAKLQKSKVKFQPAARMSKETRIEGPIAYEPFGSSAFFKDSEGNLLMVWQNNPAM